MNQFISSLFLLISTFAVFSTPLLPGVAGAACAQTLDAQYEQALKSYKATICIEEKSRKLEALRRLILTFRDINLKDSAKKLEDRCIYLTAQCYHHIFDETRSPEDMKHALENYRLVVHNHPKSPLADDSQYLSGILLMKDDPAQAYIEFAKVGIYFPGSDMQGKAAQLAAKLQQDLGYAGSGRKTGSKATSVAQGPPRKAQASPPAKGRTQAVRPPPADARSGRSSPSLAQQLGLDVRRIVIDPGHGGKDKGATGPNQTHEKDITLSLAKELKRVLEQRTGCEVLLTRSSDQFLALEERTAFANSKKADLFISIHTNAHEDKTRCGMETYFLNLAKDKESARTAAMENATSNKKISDLESILHSLMLNTKVNESSRLANEVQSRAVAGLRPKYAALRDLGVKQAPFYVLVGAEMPGILIETAFLSNAIEESRLKDRNFQKNMAFAIGSGIESYMKKMKSYAKAGDR